jgi:thiol-disulfide isomerase/thioredoxin
VYRIRFDDVSIHFENLIGPNFSRVSLPVNMKKTILVEIIVFFFVLLFVYTGVAKFAEMHLFKEQMLSSPLLGSPFLAMVITWALPIGEILLAISLFIPKLRLKALYATAFLMICFTLYVIGIVLMDNHLSCSCGGIIEELSPRQHIFFNGSCVVLSLFAISALRHPQPNRRFQRFTGSTALLIFLFIGWTIFTAFRVPSTIKTGLEGRLLPSFDLLLTDSTTHLNTADIPTGKPIIVIGFSPWCVHCQAETRDILKNIRQLSNVRIYYVTAFPFSDMQIFYKHYNLSQHPNIVMGQDAKNFYLSYFKTSGIPYTAVFDSKKRLKTVFAGEADAQKLAKIASED